MPLNVSLLKPNRQNFSVLSKISAIAKSGKPKTHHYEELDRARLAFLDRVVRVDQAGELGANYIYAGQIFVLHRKYPELRPILNHMWEQEIHHHNTFNNYQIRNRVRPSLITPIWKVGAFAMGAGTALMSPETAMACTEAVETVIGGHYNQQLRTLENQYELKDVNSQRHSKPDELKKLILTIQQFRDEEIEHLNTAIKYGAQQAPLHTAVNETIKAICKVAIFAAERI